MMGVDAAAPPALTSARLVLEPAAPAHLADLTALYGAPAVGGGTKFKRALDAGEAAALLDDYGAGWAAHGYGMFALLQRSGGAYVGEAGLRCHDRTNGPALRYAVAPAHWGQGYAAEAVIAILTWAFEQGGMTAVDAFVRADNLSSLKVLERAGVALAEELDVGGAMLRRYRAMRGRWSAPS